MSVKIADLYCHKKGSAFNDECVCVCLWLCMSNRCSFVLYYGLKTVSGHTYVRTHSHAAVDVPMKNNYIPSFGRQMVDTSNREGGCYGAVMLQCRECEGGGAHVYQRALAS